MTELGAEYRTRPGTPMIGPYSTNQMDDFYCALARGEVKTTGVMNYVQRLIVAERCQPGARVVDVCCGRGLQLPALFRYAPGIGSYVGMDIAADNLAEAGERIESLTAEYGPPPFGIELIECDVAEAWPELPAFDVAVYTSALEHLPRERGIASLARTAESLSEGGTLLLSSPNTSGESPRRLQHRVHVYEWHVTELVPVLEDVGLRVVELIGLLPPEPHDLAAQLEEVFGPAAATWYGHLRRTAPPQFLDAIAAAASPEVATELMYVCRRR